MSRETALTALFPLQNMVQKRIEAVLETLAPTLTNDQHVGGVDLAETSPNFILISRQGQLCNRGAAL